MPRVPDAVRTLVAGGFSLHSAVRNPGYALLLMRRADEFGAQHHYAFAIADNRPLTAVDIEAASISAAHDRAHLVIVGETEERVPSVEWDRFINLFGGAVHSTSPLDSEFADRLVELSHNRLPAGMEGRADDLFEAFVWAALEFILAGRVIRYGQDRRFEARPDGLAFPQERFRALYDAKAYADGYPVTAESIRQFRSYVVDFEQRYGTYLSRLNCFIVVSGEFSQSDAALAKRHLEFIADPGIPLSFLKATVLAEIIHMIAAIPSVRRSIDWARIFAAPVVEVSEVRKEIEAIRRDMIIPGI